MNDLPDITPFRIRLDELDAQMADPNLFADPQKAAMVSRDQQRMSRLVEDYDAIKQIEEQIAEARDLLKDDQADADLRELAEMELPENEARLTELQQAVLVAMIPPDPTASRNTHGGRRGGTVCRTTLSRLLPLCRFAGLEGADHVLQRRGARWLQGSDRAHHG